MLPRALLIPVALALAAAPAAAINSGPKSAAAGAVTAKVQSVSGSAITLHERQTVTVPGRVVPGHMTAPHLVGGAHPHVVPGHMTAPHQTAPHAKAVDQKASFDLAADVKVRLTVAGKTGFQTGTAADVRTGDTVRVSLGRVAGKGSDGKSATRTVVTEIDVLTAHSDAAPSPKK